MWRSFSSEDHDLRAEAAKINVPTLIIWGECDPVIPVKVSREINRAIPGSRAHVVNTGHVPQTTDPACVVEVLIPFLHMRVAANR